MNEIDKLGKRVKRNTLCGMKIKLRIIKYSMIKLLLKIDKIQQKLNTMLHF